MDLGLRGKTALVTGGASGIGQAIALALAAEGVDVAIAARRDPADTMAAIEKRGVRALGLRVDLSRESEAQRMVEETLAAWGRLDLYVNNAALAHHQPITRIDTALWWETLNVNLSACMWAGREIGRHMMSRRQGAILVIGSTVTIAPAAREAAYRVSKTGLRAYAETLALEMAPFGIRVNMLTPGAFDTPLLRRSLGDAPLEGLTAQIPLGRIGQPHECALAACFLLSDSASPYTTGAELFVDGGLRLRPLSLPDARLQDEQ